MPIINNLPSLPINGGCSYVEISNMKSEHISTTYSHFYMLVTYLSKNTIFEAYDFSKYINGNFLNFRYNNCTYNSHLTVIGEGSKTNYKIYKLTADDYILAEEILNIKIPVPEE